MYHEFPVSQVTPHAPLSPREGHTATALNGAVYLFGGTNGATTTSDMIRFTIGSARWKRVVPSTPGNTVPAARYGHSAVTHNGLIFIYGGFGPGGTPAQTTGATNDKLSAAGSSGSGLLSSLLVFNPTTGDWNSGHGRGADACGPSKNHSAVAYRGRMYVFGGCLVQGRTNALRVYDLDAGLWFAPEPGNQQAIAVAAAGDADPSSSQRLAHAEVPSPRSGHTAVISNASDGETGMYVFGGRLGKFSFSNEVFCNHISAKRWQRVYCGGDAPSPRCDHSAVAHRSHMIVCGGYSMTQPDGSSVGACKTYHSDVHILNLVSCTWTSACLLPGPSGAMPLGRCGHAAVAFQSTDGLLCMMTFGGFGKAAEAQLDVGDEDVERTLRQHGGDVVLHTSSDVWLFVMGRVDGPKTIKGHPAARRPSTAQHGGNSRGPVKADDTDTGNADHDGSARSRGQAAAGGTRGQRPESARARALRRSEEAPKAWITQTSRAAVGRTFGVPPDDATVLPHPPATLPADAVNSAVIRLTATMPLSSAKHREELEMRYLAHHQRCPMKPEEQAEMLDRVFYQRRQEVELKRQELEEKWIPHVKPERVADHGAIETIVQRLHQPRHDAQPPPAMVTVGKRPVPPAQTVRRLFYESARRQREAMAALEKKYLWGRPEKRRTTDEIQSVVARLSAASPRQ